MNIVRIWQVSLLLFVVLALALSWWFWGSVHVSQAEVSVESVSAADSFSESAEVFDPQPDVTIGYADRYSLAELVAWERPVGPYRVGIQVGHLYDSVEELPEELLGLARNGAGAVWGPYNERDVVHEIVRQAATQLEAVGIEVDILRAVVPPGYQADAFLAIHADGNVNESVRGYKIAAPRRDFSGVSHVLVNSLYESYGESTRLPIDPTITSRMSAYYAFNWNRYEHAVHPLTPSVIVEVGFLTNQADRQLMLNQPEVVAEGIVNGIQEFLASGAQYERQLEFAAVIPSFPLQGEVVCLQLRPGATARAGESCVRGVRSVTGHEYAVTFLEESQSLPVVGSLVRIETGDFLPLASFDNFLWYRQVVEGEIVTSAAGIRL